jgi:hypothetical protein
VPPSYSLGFSGSFPYTPPSYSYTPPSYSYAFPSYSFSFVFPPTAGAPTPVRKKGFHVVGHVFFMVYDLSRMGKNEESTCRTLLFVAAAFSQRSVTRCATMATDNVRDAFSQAPTLRYVR